MTAADFQTLTKKTTSESHLQQQCVRWFRLAYPQYSNLLFAIPNGGKREQKTNSKGVKYSPGATKLKAEGVLKGVPDLMLAVPSKGYCGLFIEMKRKGGKISDDQKAVLFDLQENKYRIDVVYDFDFFVETIERYLK